MAPPRTNGARAFLLLDMMTPIVKSFSAEKGFESNTLSVQIHGGYGYTSEYLPEAWLRDQKLNSIHEGTTCMHSMDLLGRKVLADQGGALVCWATRSPPRSGGRRRPASIASGARRSSARSARVGEVTMQLASLGMSGQVDAMMLHSVDYLDLFSTVVVSWQWLLQAAVAKEGLAKSPSPASAEFYEGKVCAAEYWIEDRATPGRGSLAFWRRLLRAMTGLVRGEGLRTPGCTTPGRLTSFSLPPSPERRQPAGASFSVASFRCRKTLCAIDIVGTASKRAGDAEEVLAGEQREDDEHRVDLRRVPHDLGVEHVRLELVNPQDPREHEGGGADPLRERHGDGGHRARDRAEDRDEREERRDAAP